MSDLLLQFSEHSPTLIHIFQDFKFESRRPEARNRNDYPLIVRKVHTDGKAREPV
jgi:hypothetical protein